MKIKTLLTIVTVAALAFCAMPAKADHVTSGTLFTNLVFTNAGTFTITGGNIIRLPRDTGVALIATARRTFLEEEDSYELRWSFSNNAVDWTTPINVSAAVDGFEAFAGTVTNSVESKYFPQTDFGSVTYAKIGEVRIPTGNTNFTLTVDYSFFNSGPRSTNLPVATATATLVAGVGVGGDVPADTLTADLTTFTADTILLTADQTLAP